MVGTASSLRDDAPIEARVNLTWWEYYLASLQGMGRPWSAMMGVITVGAFALLGWVAVGSYTRHGNLSRLFANNEFWIVLLVVAVMGAWHGVSINHAMRVIRRLDAAGGGRHENLYRFSVDGWSCGSGFGSTEAGWNVFEKVIETRRAFLLRSHEKIVVIVPKRCFARDEDCARFRSIVFGTIG